VNKGTVGNGKLFAAKLRSKAVRSLGRDLTAEEAQELDEKVAMTRDMGLVWRIQHFVDEISNDCQARPAHARAHSPPSSPRFCSSEGLKLCKSRSLYSRG